MRAGQARKRDRNEAEIVSALRAVGAYVMALSGDGVPDLIVLWHERLFLLEIKTARGRATSAQDVRAAQGWPISTCRTVDEALGAIGAFVP